MFFNLRSDKDLGKHKQPKWIKLDDSRDLDPITVQESENSVCIFDGIGVISEKKVREGGYNIRNDIVELGDDCKTNCIVANRLVLQGKHARQIHHEAHTVTDGPRNARGHIKYLLHIYIYM